MEKQKCPDIRFMGSNGDWVQSNLAECTDLLTGNPFNSKEFTSNGIFLVRGMNVKRGYLDKSTNLSEYWPSSKGLEQYLLKPEDIVIQMDGALIGKSYAKINSKDLPALLVQRVTRVRSNNVEIEFIYQYIHRDFLSHISGIKTETAVPHLSLNDIRDFTIFLPEKQEQSSIGSFFQSLDQSITLHEKKLTQTQNLKKAMLEKMFPKAGNKQPEIRLKGFSGNWDVDIIGNVLQEAFRPINLDNETKYRLVTVKRRNGGIAERAILKGKDILVKSQFEVKAGDYVISKRQVVHGATGLVPHELDGSIVSNEYLVGQGTDKLNIEFFALLSTLPEMYKKFFLSSYGVDIEKLFFDVSDWKKREISLPCLAEQIQISKFFKQLDETLVLQQQQLQTLKNLKQAFLEKMFV
ncbi:restriction endonuclease subunit S [Acinetobacter haemolyticus]|uniref:Restriction endonuclease subunit S n=1 Tax=Acinetobacter haemolyticus TaxID=29430 RepID=A0A857IM16_ACIHA|nr:restriction endonuclease subunit S [Acinetobacter haemolyticus]QHI11062.1 restriction endonuclease subunit S [Acinetobacter haemolyticus]QHI14334.1 restriction endonuclease subunit S [Acinetobacter haemolyticus]QHI27156.1 restriction endonuclease subunit S [Acinetobacter haemolyticus]